MPEAVVAVTSWIAAALTPVIGATLAGIVANLGVTLAISAAVSVLSPSADPGARLLDPAQFNQLSADPLSERVLAYGETAIAGEVVAQFVHSDKKWASFVIALAESGQASGHTLQKVLIDGNEVTLDGSGNCSTAPYIGKLQIRFYGGTAAQTADATLITDSGGVWTTNHRGRGICYAIMTAKLSDQDAFPSGRPNPLFVIRGRRVYDPRLDSTVAGGSGSQRVNDDSTWTWSNNAVLCAYDYARGIYVGTRRVAGLGLPSRLISLDWVIASANASDDRGWTINGPISSASDPADVLNSFAQHMCGRIATRKGLLSIIAGDDWPSVLTIYENDLAGPVKIKAAKNWRDSSNAVKGAFRNSATSYEAGETNLFVVDDWVTADNGERFERSVSLPFTHSLEQATRLAKFDLYRSRSPRTLEIAVKLRKCRAFEGDFVDVQFPGYGMSETYEVTDWKLDQTGYASMTLELWNEEGLAWSSGDEGDPPSYGVLSRDLAPPQPVSGDWTVSALAYQSRLPTLHIVGTAPDWLDGAIIEWREHGATAWNLLTQSTSAATDVIVQLAPNVSYDVSIRYRFGARYSARRTYTATTPNVFDAATAGVAGSIIGQAPAATDSTIQAGATKNSLTYSGSAPSSPTDGDLWADTTTTPVVWKVRTSGAWVSVASLGGVFGSTLLETGGGVAATLANFKTALGIASGIASQAPAATDSTIQTGATKNTLTYSASAPSSPTNGDLWGDTSTTPVVWKVRVSGAWQNAASYGGVFGSTLLETAGGSTATLANFKTALGIASGISGQAPAATDSTIQSGATKNTLTYSSSAPSSPTDGDLWADNTTTPVVWKIRDGGAWVNAASLGGVFGSTLFETGGGVAATLANFKTALGVASAISGQAAAATDSTIQSGATKNTLTFSSSAPSSPTNGDLWGDTTTTPIVWKVRVSGAWQAVASYGAVFGSTLLETSGGTTATLANFKTALGIASGIASQGDLATMNKAQLPFGVNGAPNSEFANGSSFAWFFNVDGNTGLSINGGVDANLSGTLYYGGRHVAWSHVSGTPANGTYWLPGYVYGWNGGLSSLQRYGLNVKAGDRIFASIEASIYRASGAYIYVRYFDKANNYLGQDVMSSGGAYVSGATNGDPALFGRVYGFGTAPANSAFAVMGVLVFCNGSSDPYCFWTDCMLCVVPSGQTALPDYAPGQRDKHADATPENIAAGFAGAGSWSTRSSRNVSGGVASAFDADPYGGRTTTSLTINSFNWSGPGGESISYGGGTVSGLTNATKYRVFLHIASGVPYAIPSGSAASYNASEAYLAVFTATTGSGGGGGAGGGGGVTP